MTEYFLDTFAWIEYLEASRKGELIKEIIENNTNAFLQLCLFLNL
ncbi:MAG TPA: hypothetical protein VJK05_04020 [archaeon]|nr:hypothetical protein [archaeon]